LNERLIDEIEHFFVAYNEIKGKKFQPLKRAGAIKAKRIVEEGLNRIKGGA
jgi:inorganic pyrophosphatase